MQELQKPIEAVEIIKSLSGGVKNESCSGGIFKDAIGKHVIVRSRNEGINFGVVVEADETGVILEDSIRVWYHKPADKDMAWYEGVAVSGLSSDSKISVTVERKVIVEDYSITYCTEKAVKSFEGHKPHGRR